MRMDAVRLAEAYRSAKEFVIGRGYGAEIDWQRDLDLSRVTEPAFLAEAAWVVLSCGMRETVVRRTFGAVSGAFLEWESASRIAGESEACVSAALRWFNHRGKITAIAKIACQVDSLGFAHLKREIASEGVSRLRTFPFMGPATSYHLAKNIGMDVVKPDRHLLRITEAAGHPCPASLCRELSGLVGDRIAVVDLVLWRFATLVPDYLSCFSSSASPAGSGPANHPS